MSEVKQREIWVDNVKVIACVLVVFGHFFQSMTKAGIIPTNDLYRWFNQTIYFFHVPLFFICSGYLYQKSCRVNEFHGWVRNIEKKLLNLGIPYFVFSLTTWVLKTVFSSSTNDQIGGLFDTLFLHPTSPYWYLYALFFIFMITPTFRDKKMAIAGIAVAIAFKTLGLTGGYGIQAVSYIFSYEIWFVIGMCANIWDVKNYWEKNKIVLPIGLGAFFVGLSVVIYIKNINREMINFALGMFACCSIIMIIMILFKDGKQLPIFGYLAKYTPPIFLMHTLFAAPLRTLLFKIGLQNAILHVILGIVISFVGPIIAAKIMERSKWLEFLLYPSEFIKI